MESDMKILPINTDPETHINFYLSMILTNENMRAWFYERYINLVMYEDIIDFIDNINYSGIIGHVRSYSWDEGKQRGICKVIKEVIQGNGFLNFWVDEYNLPCSIRYQKQHFVHPIIVYGYDDRKKIFNAWFFDIGRGYRTVEILQQDFINAVDDVKDHYQEGGTDESINQTIAIYGVYASFPALPFNLEVFLSQLKDYLYGQNNSLLQWYTLGRPELFASQTVFFGINIYLRLIEIFQNGLTDFFLPYKSLHDFILQKKQLLLRLKFIQDYYEVNDEYCQCVLQIEKVKDLLENVRLMNMRFLMKEGRNPATISNNIKILSKILAALKESYNIEMQVIPKIYKLLHALAYPKNYFCNYETKTLTMFEGDFRDEYIEFNLTGCGQYLYRIDVLREGEYEFIDLQEKLILNNEQVYYIESDSPDHLPIRRIDFQACLVNNIKIYTDITRAKYKFILFLLPGQENREGCTLRFDKDTDWHNFHHIENIVYKETYIKFNITGIDPNMTYNNLGVNADHVKYIQVRMKTNDKICLSKIFFSTVDSPNISPEKSVEFHIHPDDNMRTYTIDMSEHPKWKGLIQTIRLDPIECKRDQIQDLEYAECCLESISFTKHPPIYDS